MLRGYPASNYFNSHFSYKKPALKYLTGVSFHTSIQDPYLPDSVAGMVYLSDLGFFCYSININRISVFPNNTYRRVSQWSPTPGRVVRLSGVCTQSLIHLTKNALLEVVKSIVTSISGSCNRKVQTSGCVGSKALALE